MIFSSIALYFFTFLSAFILSLVLTPAARSASIIFNILDHPSSSIKTHKQPVPYFGGVAIFLAFTFSLLWVRVLTSFPTGTLTSLRGILIGGGFIFIVGLLDDIKHHGLHYRTKFLFQTIAAVVVMLFDIRIKFIQPIWLGWTLTMLWVVGITNAFNLIDIMDGLASTVAIVTSLAFLFISLPTEEIYVNFAAASLAGAALGFLPYNLSKNWKIFMGDSGSLLLGFVLAVLAMGTSYTGKTELGVLAPIFILALPIFDTTLVFILRIRRGISPFLGSKDHFPLRLEALGWPRSKILVFIGAITMLFSGLAYLVTQTEISITIGILALILLALVVFVRYLVKAKIE